MARRHFDGDGAFARVDRGADLRCAAVARAANRLRLRLPNWALSDRAVDVPTPTFGQHARSGKATLRTLIAELPELGRLSLTCSSMRQNSERVGTGPGWRFALAQPPEAFQIAL
jgi:hypothetical protein